MRLRFIRGLTFLIILLFVIGCSRSSNTRKTNELVLKAPDSAESGDAIPLTLLLPDYIGSGSEITIFVNMPTVSFYGMIILVGLLGFTVSRKLKSSLRD